MDFDAIVERFENGADTQQDVHNLICYIEQLRLVVDELEEEVKRLSGDLKQSKPDSTCSKEDVESVGC